ncbi:MAG TPA: hypothetical protein VN606_09230 [Thermoleophilaceae bacterium]|nr:hypothetical protein [Thermoleophilaceae bacterium]
MAHVARRRALRVRPAVAVAGGCLALAALSLLLSWRPTYDPWAWLVFGREVSDPHLGFSTLAHTGWKPLAVLFTAPFGLFGSAAPFLWMIVPRAAGLASLALAYRLGSRSAGVVAGVVAAVALALSADWLRYMAGANIEPIAVACLLGAIELHLNGRRKWSFVLVTLVGLARPEIWPVVGLYALYLWFSERSWWPLLVGIPVMLGLWILPDWAGSSELFHTFHSATISGEPTDILDSKFPAATLFRRSLGILVAPVWIAALVGAVVAWRTRERTAVAVLAVALAWSVVTIGGEAIGYPAVPRYLVEPAALCCVLAGIGVASLPRRAWVIGLLVLAFAPFVVARSIGLGTQVSAANERARDLSALWHAADQVKGPIVHPMIAPQKQGTALVWKLHVKLNGVHENPSRQVRILFVKPGENPPGIEEMKRAGASFTQIASSGDWRVWRVSWPPA